MKKVASIVLAAFTSAMFAGSAMAATSAPSETHKATEQKVATHQIHKKQQTDQVKKQHVAKTATKKVEGKTSAAKS